MGEVLWLMVVYVYLDDEFSKGVATMVRYFVEGVEVFVVMCIGGEWGDIFNLKFKDDFDLLWDIV